MNDESASEMILGRQTDWDDIYYLLEKECAFRSPLAAARGFKAMDQFVREQLRLRHAPLPTIPS